MITKYTDISGMFNKQKEIAEIHHNFFIFRTFFVPLGIPVRAHLFCLGNHIFSRLDKHNLLLEHYGTLLFKSSINRENVAYLEENSS